jgi:hypothetical protein
MINLKLAEKQKLSQETIKNIEKLHEEVQLILNAMKVTDDKNQLQQLSDDWHNLQFKLQKLWGFKEDINYHPWWELPKCTCPKLDNNDAWPTGFYCKIQDCPIHGFDINDN